GVGVEGVEGGGGVGIKGGELLGGGDGVFLERRGALLPLLLHRDPRRLLHLGVGTGDTLGAALSSPGLTADGVELVAGALDVAPLFADQNADVAPNPLARLTTDHALSDLLPLGA